jgi:hypothetical protein
MQLLAMRNSLLEPTQEVKEEQLAFTNFLYEDDPSMLETSIKLQHHGANPHMQTGFMPSVLQTFMDTLKHLQSIIYESECMKLERVKTYANNKGKYTKDGLGGAVKGIQFIIDQYASIMNPINTNSNNESTSSKKHNSLTVKNMRKHLKNTTVTSIFPAPSSSNIANLGRSYGVQTEANKNSTRNVFNKYYRSNSLNELDTA